MRKIPRAATAIALLALAGCSTSLPPLSQASFAAGPPADSTPAANAACRERANESFERGERSSAIETGRNPVDSPFSSVPIKQGIHGLATQSSFNQSYADCLRARAPAQAVRPTVSTTKP